ncbi:hypothetical protein D3C85_1554110 [compost metagenome]
MGHLQKRQHVLVNPRHPGKTRGQQVNDRRHAAPPVQQVEDLPGADVELDHAFGVQQHVTTLARFPLQTKTLAQGRCLLAFDQAHRAIPRCQTFSLVTV